jgi:hypothetical protein
VHCDECNTNRASLKQQCHSRTVSLCYATGHWGGFTQQFQMSAAAGDTSYHHITAANLHALSVAVSCLFSDNVCIMSCQTEDAARERELENLVHGSADFVCPNVDGASTNISERQHRAVTVTLEIQYCAVHVNVTMFQVLRKRSSSTQASGSALYCFWQWHFLLACWQQCLPS